MISKDFRKVYQEINNNNILLNKLTDNDKHAFGLNNKKLSRLKWHEIDRRFRIEPYDYRRNKNIVNALRVIKRDIFLLIQNYATDIVFKNAQYNPFRKKVNLAFNKGSDILDLIPLPKIEDLNSTENIYTLRLAIETFTTIEKEKRLNLSKNLEVFYQERYQSYVLKANTMKDDAERDTYINSLCWQEMKITAEPEKPVEPPYEPENKEQGVGQGEEEKQPETAQEADIFDIPVFVGKKEEQSKQPEVEEEIKEVVDDSKKEQLNKLFALHSKLKGDAE